MKIYFLVYLIAYFALHSILADLKVKRFLTKTMIPQRYFRIIYNLLAIVLLLPIAMILPRIQQVHLLKVSWLSYIGIALLSLGFLCLFVALSQYNLSEFAGTAQLQKNGQPASCSLKVAGFNAIVRHPLYFSMLLMAWGLFMTYPTDLVLIGSSIISLYLYVGTKLEEHKLVAEFGEAYLSYQKKVSMLFPFKYFFNS